MFSFPSFSFDIPDINIPGVDIPGIDIPDIEDIIGEIPSFAGTDGDDVFNGTDGDDVFNGGEGNDTLNGSIGDDFLEGGDGDDVLDGGDNEDILFGGAGNDSILGGAGNDFLDGGLSGNDTLIGGAGNDEILAGNGNDLIDGGDGIDNIIAGSGNDEVRGGNDDDVILGDSGNDSLDGGRGNDFIDGGTGDNFIFGGAGNDEILASLGNQTLIGESGNDEIIATGLGNDLIYGDFYIFANPSAPSGFPNIVASDDENFFANAFLPSNDDIIAGDGSNIIFGGSGSDTIAGLGGDDYIDGGYDAIIPALAPQFGGWGLDAGGNDSLSGGAGNDILVGNLGNDTLNGGGAAPGEIDILIGTYSFDIDGNGPVSRVDTDGDGTPDAFSLPEAIGSDLGIFVGDADTFVIGNANGNFYTGGLGQVTTFDGTLATGFADRAIIWDFENGFDRIQVNGPVQEKVYFDPNFGGIGTILLGVTTTNSNFEVIAQVFANSLFNGSFAAGTFIDPPPTIV